LLIWEKLRIPWADRGETMTTKGVKDLKLAANFVKSIETEDHQVNLEIQGLARRIEYIASRLSARHGKSDRPPST
jgi:hypothetical protein